MITLALNCGSSTVKCRLLQIAPDAPEADRERTLAMGLIEGLSEEGGTVTFRTGGPVERAELPSADHEAAVRALIGRLTAAERALPRIDAVGHRVVHGGDRFVEPTLIDHEVLRAIEAVEELAPLHNAPSLAGIRAARAALPPDLPMVAVFDTAFHASLPERARRYAIPSDLALRHAIRRFGFHGLSYQSALSSYSRITGIPAAQVTLVALHLGSGCSAAAIMNGRSIDTSMGFTPLEGLVMGTRSGDLDPALVGYLARKEGVPVETVEEWLSARSGILGLSALSHDMRTLLMREGSHPGARLAIDVFCYRARKYVGAYLAALGGAQAVVFTGGIAENSPEIRARISDGMEWCGLALDPSRNAAAVGREARISRDDARLQAYAIPTDEELVIARETVRCVKRTER